ncbi:MAG: 1-deoxy-D-xylulose-5-phosphate synthase [Candidatus Marinimicrobia bacterium]|nr:1-deoxy-D-xylulose-5-phosphate synthase [Candidatus Neomarinimicrobiota bacterium]
MKKLLEKVNSPEDLKDFSYLELESLSSEIAEHIKNVVSKLGGHYSSPLGVVDLTLALHYVYNSPNDKLIWDVGHQAYSHKIITGRRKEFLELRSKNGISGFLKRDESEHDIIGAGHASTSISAALGLAHARDRLKESNNILAIIGDGAATGGMAFEGLNNLGYHRTQLTVVLNDNSMSISGSVGALSRYLTKVVTNPTYNKIRNDIWNLSGKISESDNNLIRRLLRKTEEGIKGILTPGILFEELGLRYIGPIDGTNIKDMIDVFTSVKEMKTPVLVHVHTMKGKGCTKAEKNSVKYYSLSPSKKSSSSISNYSNVFGDALIDFAELHEFKCVTAAMPIGTGMDSFTKKYADRYIDVGIAEEHAVTYASGLSAGGILPIVAIYSTFMQRSYDQIFHDCLLQNLPIVFCMDRAGLVGEDGPTHHGVYDIAFLRSLPNIIITAPKDGNELKSLLLSGIKSNKAFSIRYPKGSSILYDPELEPEILKIGSWELLNHGNDIAILAVGSMVHVAKSTLKLLENDNINITLVNCRFIKPLDEKMLEEIFKNHKTIITIEEGTVLGGFGSSILEYASFNNIRSRINVLGIPDKFIQHGPRNELLDDIGLSKNKLYTTIKEILNEEK